MSKLSNSCEYLALCWCLFMPAAIQAAGPLKPAKPPQDVEVRLEGRASDLGRETVSFGLPLPPGFLADARRSRVVDKNGREIEAAVRALEPWRIDGTDGTIRSVLVQFTADFSKEKTQRVRVVFGKGRRRDSELLIWWKLG